MIGTQTTLKQSTLRNARDLGKPNSLQCAKLRSGFGHIVDFRCEDPPSSSVQNIPQLPQGSASSWRKIRRRPLEVQGVKGTESGEELTGTQGYWRSPLSQQQKQ